ncbi:MAG: hypothetical protein HPY59_10275 [Anaerolineae bacterium]|nr:hypothetical protein [Anaerolineae bacterium]
MLLGLLLLTLTTVPYLFGYFAQGDIWRFTGFVFGVEDGNSYIAKMLRGANGDWLFRTPYTSTPQSGFLVFLPYLLIGKLTAPPGQHEQLVGLYQLFRWFAGMAMVLATYDFISMFIRRHLTGLFATALIVAGGGLGWLSLTGLGFLKTGRMPLEFYSPETFGFLSFYGLPHLALSRSLMLWGFIFFFKCKKNPGLWGGIMWLLLSFVQPLTVLTGWFLLAIYCILLFFVADRGGRRSLFLFPPQLYAEIKQILVMVVISSPLVFYTFLSLRLNPFVGQWAKQNLLLSPPIADYVLSFSLFLPFLIGGIWKIFNSSYGSTGESKEALILVSWVVSFPLLAYFPYNVQRRLPDGVWVAIIILTILGSTGLPKKLQRYFWGIMSVGFISSVLLLAGGIVVSLRPAPPIFRPLFEVKAFLFLAQNVEGDSVLLCSYETGNAVPAWAPIRVLIGHGPESAQLEELKPLVSAFYSSDLMAEFERKNFLREYYVDYVLLGENEHALGNWRPDNEAGYRKIYDQDNYQIYKVLKDAAAE